MSRILSFILCALLSALPLSGVGADAGELVLPLSVYRDKVKAAWLGKMVGVSVGILREFRYRGTIAPESQVPEWDESLLSIASIEDDIYLPFVLLQEMDRRGTDISSREMVLALYPYSFEFWDGHQRTWEKGIAPPDAGHPTYAPFPDGLSYSFAADYSGLIAPGRPDIPMELADRFGEMLVYGDGIYGGAYVGALYSKVFFESDMLAIVESAVSVVPEDSWFYECISDVITCYRNDPADWQSAWEMVTDKYFRSEEYNWIQWPYGGRIDGINLDSKLNCAYITIALLYGRNDIDKTLNIAIRCGQDCDSNAANALGVLFALIGYEKLPQTFKNPLNTFPAIRYANASFDELLNVTERVAREVLVGIGAGFEVVNGEETMLIPASVAETEIAVNSKAPLPLQSSLFTASEMDRLGKPALQNGDFEEDWHDAIHLPWMLEGHGTGGIDLRKGKANDGRNNAWLSAAEQGTVMLTQNRIMVDERLDYTLAAMARSSGNIEVGFLRILKSGGNGEILADVQFGAQNKYNAVTLSFNSVTATHVNVQIGYQDPGASSWLQIDDVKLEESNP